MAITFTKLRWKNFLATGNEFIELDLGAAKTTLIIGRNGSGKSTLIDALLFALFGRPFRKINKSQLVNTITRGDTMVEVEFSIGSHCYRVRRGIKPNLFEIYLDGKMIDQPADTRDYQDMLERQILKVNHRTFSQVVVLGSALYVPFMELPAAQRREVVEELLDLQIFSKMNVIMKAQASQTAAGQIAINNDMLVMREKVRLQEKYVEEANLEFEQMIKTKWDQREQQGRERDTFKNQLNDANKDISAKRVELEEETELQERLRTFLDMQAKIKANQDRLREEVDFFQSHDECPSCHQSITPEHKHTMVLNRNVHLDEIEQGLMKLKGKIDKVNVLLKEKDAVRNQLLTAEKARAAVFANFGNASQKIVDLDNEIDWLRRRQGAFSSDAKTLEELRAAYVDLEKKYLELELEKETFGQLASLLKDDGIKARIISQYVPVINQLIAQYLEALDFFVEFTLDENFDEKIYSRYRDDFSYNSFSQGQKFRLNVAILFTWRELAKMRNSLNTNLLVLDEIMDSSLDVTGQDDFLKIIHGLSPDTNTFIISHNVDAISDKFDRVLKFETVGNFSELEKVV